MSGRTIASVDNLTVVLTLLLAVSVATLIRLSMRLRHNNAEVAVALSTAAAELGATPSTITRATDALVGRVEEARRRAAFVESAVEGSTEGVLALGPDFDVLLATGAARRILEGSRGTAAAVARVRRLAQDVMEAGEPSETRFEVATPEVRVFEAAAEAVSTDAGPGVTIQITDVTEHERVEAIRRDFVANVSHELKTPVGALVVLAEALDGAETDDLRRRLTARMQSESRRVAALVDDILDLSLVESEAPEMEPVDMVDVVREASQRVAVVAADAGMDIVVGSPDGPIVISGDPRQLVSAVANLLDNAVKYSAFRRDPDACVWIRVFTSGPTVVVEVEDKGVGIPERHRARIFERFYRVDRARSRSQGGTGLGLAIVRHVALNHGGTVEVESTPGVGSTFRIVLPVEVG
jgi:two-component system sensor histidine kinase SenX3